MGKLITFLSILIFADLIFLATGQICAEETCTITSILFNALLDIGNLTFSDFFTQLVGSALLLFNSTTGFLALVAAGGVIIGTFIATREITVLFIPVAFALAVLASDFVIITAYLISLNPLVAFFIMAPLSIIYVFVVVEWLRGKD